MKTMNATTREKKTNKIITYLILFPTNKNNNGQWTRAAFGFDYNMPAFFFTYHFQ